MGDLEFHLYKVPSESGDWLAVYEGKEIIFMGSYNVGKKSLEKDLNEFFHRNYHFHLGSFQALPWTQGNFWKKKHKVKLQGTEFQVKVWLELVKIPRGSTVTYSDLAKKMRKPTAFRAVASAVAKNPVSYWIPCHRVVGKGTSQMKYHWGAETKRALLTQEGAL